MSITFSCLALFWTF